MSEKELIVVGGPNGSGKSTFVAASLAQSPAPYFCADAIAKEFAHLEPMPQQIAAGREFLRRIDLQLDENVDFIIESTLSGRTLRNFLSKAKNAGYRITVVFVYLNSPDTCVLRVQQRVRGGGHNVPEADIRRRFARSCANFWQIYRKIADYWYVVYNSTAEFKRIATGDMNSIAVRDASQFQEFLHLAGDK